jgi:hypothetical protein
MTEVRGATGINEPEKLVYLESQNQSGRGSLCPHLFFCVILSLRGTLPGYQVR